MKKRILALIMALVMCLSLFPITAMAEGVTEIAGGTDGNISWSLDSNGTLTLSGTGDMKNYLYESTECEEGYLLYPSAPWGKYYSSITKLVIEDGITSIGQYAFYCCDNLTSVTIGDSVTSIGDIAFCFCRKITSLSIGNSVKSIGQHAFSNCDSLTSVTIPNSVESIGDYAFYNCSSLTSIVVSDNNNSFCSVDGVLYNKDKTELICYPAGKTVASFSIPDSVTSIGHNAFYRCSSLTSVTIPDSVTSIGYYAFSDCSKLTSVTIGDSVTSIGHNAFHGTALYHNLYDNSYRILYIGNYLIAAHIDISSCSIREGTLCIADDAFYGCSGLMSVTIPNSVTSIGGAAFYNCSSLTSVTIPDSVTSIGGAAFYNCSSLTSVTIPDSVTSIRDDAFYGCSSLTSVTIPDSVTSIGGYAFERCSKLKNVYYNGDISSWINITFSNWASNLCCNGADLFFDGIPVTSIVIPDNVSTIKPYAFYGCSSLTSVELPNSIESIGNEAFSGCSKLNNVYYNGELSSWMNITFKNSASNPCCYGADLFFEGIPVTSIVIPDNVSTIKPYAFYGCSGLMSVTIPNSVKSIGDYAFWDCNNIRIVYFEGTVGQWVNLNIESGNDDLTKAIIVFKGGDSHQHDYKTVSVVAPTCVSYGYKVYTCVCGAFYTSDLVPAMGHSYTKATDVVTDPTCTDKGYTTHICAVCGFSFIDSMTNRVQHDFGNWILTVKPSCVQTGIETRSCKNCGHLELHDTGIMGGHFTELQGARVASCSEEGYTGDEVCLICDKTISSGESIACTDHNYRDGKCTVCNADDPNNNPGGNDGGSFFTRILNVIKNILRSIFPFC